MFDDLKSSIVSVLDSADDTGCSEGLIVVSKETLMTLQAEYNIHFVEPEDEQLEIL